jgi:hypothetical protein
MKEYTQEKDFCTENELPHQKSTPNTFDASYKKVLQIIFIIG